MSPKLRALLVVGGVSLLLDQASKIWTVSALRYRGPPLDERAAAGLESLGHAATNPPSLDVVPGFLTLIHAQNPAAAMGAMLGFEHRMIVFGVFTVIAVLVLGSMYRALAPDDRAQAGILGLLLSGALGNGIDRAHKGTVTDMISVHWDFEPGRAWLMENLGTNTYYTWNVADAALVVGVGLYLVVQLLQRDREDPAEDVGPGPVEAS